MLERRAEWDFNEILGPDGFSTRLEDRIMFASDATNRDDHRPDAVAWPRTARQAAALIRLARKYRLPVVPRGAGSGLSGGALPVTGGLIVVLTHLDKILDIDPIGRTALVEPGVITADFQEAAARLGLFYPPDPSSRDFCTLGGNAAENAGGTRAVKYGVTRDYILGLQAVLGTGEIVETGASPAGPGEGCDLTQLLVGSEGALGVITRLTLRLIPQPEARETLVAYYGGIAAATRTVAALTRARIVPATIEFMDRASLECVADYTGLELAPETGAMLLIETDGHPVQARRDADAALAICRENGAFSARRAAGAAEAETMWKARRAISPALFRVATGKMNEDVVVPRTRIPEMLARMDEIAARRGVRIINFGHAGDGNIHVNVMFEKRDPGGEVRGDP